MNTVLAHTRTGRLAGTRVAGVRQWLGVPYARAERFAAPDPFGPWTGVRPASRFAPQCPQLFGSKARRAMVDPPAFVEGECLALNVWAPEREPRRPRPVLVWIHGGAFTVGGSNIYNGAELARSGDIVVVGINYRLGVLGFVNFGAVLDQPKMPSNLGLRDQIAALEWVREHIADFGGDPDKVTIAGESAGSISVSLLMVAPRAWPLFHGAIMQSGSLSLIHDRPKSIALARRYLRLLGLDARTRDQLGSMDPRALLAVQGRINAMERPGVPAAPWFDGELLPPSLDAAHAHAHAPVPLIAGATRDEARLFELLPGDILPTQWPELEGLVRRHLRPEAARRVLAAYPRTKQGRRDLATDLVFAIPTRHFAERHAGQGRPTWYYRFDYSHPLAGACHGLDLLMFWPGDSLQANLARGGRQTGKRRALGQRMRGHWAHFTKYGRPGEGWPRYLAKERQVYLFGKSDRLTRDPDGQRFAAWRDALARSSASEELSSP